MIGNGSLLLNSYSRKSPTPSTRIPGCLPGGLKVMVREQFLHVEPCLAFNMPSDAQNRQSFFQSPADSAPRISSNSGGGKALNVKQVMLQPAAMKINRRQFIQVSSLSLGAVSLAPEWSRRAAASEPASFIVRPARGCIWAGHLQSGAGLGYPHHHPELRNGAIRRGGTPHEPRSQGRGQPYARAAPGG